MKLIQLKSILALFLSLSVNADIIVSSSDVINDGQRSHFNSFESAVYNNDPQFNYTYDNISVDSIDGDVGSYYNGSIPDGSMAWYHRSGDFGYAKITLADGGDISAMGLYVGHGFANWQITLIYELFNNGTSVHSGQMDNWVNGYLGFTGDVFDELRILVTNDAKNFNYFGDGTFQAVALDAIEVQTPNSIGVPEPRTIAIFLFSLIGLAYRTKIIEK